MALPPSASNEAFLREVDEELRRDRLAGFWERYGRLLLVAVGAALLLYAGFLFWQSRQRAAAGVEGEQLQAAYDSLGAGQPAAAAAPLERLTQSKTAAMRALALFTQGDVLLQRDDGAGAAAKFRAVAADDDVAQPLRDLALIRQTAAEYDRLQPQQVIDRLRPLAVPNGAYLGSAGELVAVAYLRQGRRDLAGRLFADMARDPGVPATIRQRAVQMAGDLGVDATGPGPALVGAPGGGDGNGR